MEHAFEPGQIVKGLEVGEAVEITAVKPMGPGYLSIAYIGKTSQRANSKVLSPEKLAQLTVISAKDTFNFRGSPEVFGLGVEAERIHTAYQFDPLFAVNCSIVDPLPHQVEAVYSYLLPLPKIRFLLADDTGAGKTIMAGLLLKELFMRGLIERVLVITPGGLTKQWQEDELGIKFNLNFALANRAQFNAEPNLFSTRNCLVASIDFISRDDVLQVLEKTHWDLVIFDEAHKLSAYDYGRKSYKSRRYQAAEVLAERCEHLLLLTATPHRGRKDTFKRLLQLLDEDIFATEDLAADRVQELSQNGVNKFFIRRLKEDMKDWQGAPLYKKRSTRTISYELSAPEKELYDAVTNYLTDRKKDAADNQNIHVRLALAVMQRRLASSLRAIRITLGKRHMALSELVEEINKNPNLWKQRHKLDEIEAETVFDYEDMDDAERQALEDILANPKKFSLFTTAKSLQELRQEADQVQRLYQQAQDLEHRGVQETKYQRLTELLSQEGKAGEEKLVIFTEHKDTLYYLQEKLENSGYTVATIHGGKNVDERREAQWHFAKEAQVLLATDAAGEGVNLQFCKLLINWDIPWNPNRLEQRMGRIHRYGQKEDVLVFNMVAGNTLEGSVLTRLLEKLDIIREAIGDDRVYDVIQDVLEGVSLEEVYGAVYNHQTTALTQLINEDPKETQRTFEEKIAQQKDRMGHAPINYAKARELKDRSDERRLQPIYVRLFFEQAFTHLSGTWEAQANEQAIFKLTQLPEALTKQLKNAYNIHAPNLLGSAEAPVHYCFDKQVFLDYQNQGRHPQIGTLHYINPGNPLFDALVATMRQHCKEALLQGTVLVSPEDPAPYLAFLVKSQIADRRPQRKGQESISHETLTLVARPRAEGATTHTSPAKFLDLKAPSAFAKAVETPTATTAQDLEGWYFEHLTLPQLQETQQQVAQDVAARRNYLEEAFRHLIADYIEQISALQQRITHGHNNHQEKLADLQQRLTLLQARRTQRFEELEQRAQLEPKTPQVLGCAYVLPLTAMEFTQHTGMQRDTEVEAIAMEAAMDYERKNLRVPKDVSAQNLGYDLSSQDENGLKRYIEVKGRAHTGDVMLSENEKYRLDQLGQSAWLYVVTHCKSGQPQVHTIQNPGTVLHFKQLSKGIQFLVPQKEWEQNAKP